jgi:hypothetical protein
VIHPPANTALGTVAAIERLRAGRATSLEIEGTSMEPLLVAGETVRVEPCRPEDLRVGDLVAFERDGRVILHRVLRRGARTGDVTEKGDNAALPTRVAPCRVLGRATMRLDPPRPLRPGPGIARLSALHGAIHASAGRLATLYPRSGLAAALRLLDGLLRAARRLAIRP